MSNPPAPAAALRHASDLHRAGRSAEAERFARQAVAREPSSAPAHGLLADILVTLRKSEQALYHAERAADLERTGALYRNYLGIVLSGLGRLDEGERAFRRAIADAPDDPRPHHNLAKLLFDLGEAAPAADAIRDALRRSPSETWPLSLLANSSVYFIEGGPELLGVHREFARAFEGSIRPMTDVPPARDPERALRVGLLSPDFRNHSVASFMEEILRDVDPARARLLCFSTTTEPDDVTARLRALAPEWHDARNLSDAAIAELIRRERTDILVDLAGLTSGGRPGVFAMRPAPVQVAYCGYLSTTGMSSIGWRIIDDLTDPPGSESHWSERLIRIPGCHLCWTPPADAPDPGPPPCLDPAHHGRIAFGSFNALHKLCDSCLDLWADVLRAVPDSILLLKAGALKHPTARRRLQSRLAARGVEAARVEYLASTASTRDHLALYGRVDIGLDTTPFNGATTTCEALWMGVPVLTLLGSRHASRICHCILTGAGITGWSAATRDEFVAMARAYAADREGLAALRPTLRPRLAASLLCDGRAFAPRFEHALRDIWREACRSGA